MAITRSHGTASRTAAYTTQAATCSLSWKPNDPPAMRATPMNNSDTTSLKLPRRDLPASATTLAVASNSLLFAVLPAIRQSGNPPVLKLLCSASQFKSFTDLTRSPSNRVKVGGCRCIGLPSALLPIFQRRQRNPKSLSEFRLRHPQLTPDGAH